MPSIFHNALNISTIGNHGNKNRIEKQHLPRKPFAWCMFSLSSFAIHSRMKGNMSKRAASGCPISNEYLQRLMMARLMRTCVMKKEQTITHLNNLRQDHLRKEVVYPRKNAIRYKMNIKTKSIRIANCSTIWKVAKMDFKCLWCLYLYKTKYTIVSSFVTLIRTL